MCGRDVDGKIVEMCKPFSRIGQGLLLNDTNA